MKTLVYGLVVGTVLVLGGVRLGAEEEPAEGMEHILEHYLPIGKSLAGDNLKGVSENADHIAEMAEELSKVNCRTTEEEKKKCQERINTIKSSAEKMKSDKIEDVRTAFGDLSNALIDCLGKCPVVLEKEYYIFHCSMVKKHWIQEDKKVSNPYGGKEMLKCGELQKTIGGKSKGEHEEGEKGHPHSSKGACPFIKGETGTKERVSGCCAM